MKNQSATCSHRALSSVVGICCSGRESSPTYSIVVRGASRTAGDAGGVKRFSWLDPDGLRNRNLRTRRWLGPVALITPRPPVAGLCRGAPARPDSTSPHFVGAPRWQHERVIPG